MADDVELEIWRRRNLDSRRTRSRSRHLPRANEHFEAAGLLARAGLGMAVPAAWGELRLPPRGSTDAYCSDLKRPNGTPVGSARIANRPTPGVSNGSMKICAPSSFAFSAWASTSSLMMYTSQCEGIGPGFVIAPARCWSPELKIV